LDEQNFNRGETFGGERFHGFMRTDLRRRNISGRGGESFREERAFGWRESENFRKNGCLVTRIVEFGIANRE
jgi:hypothetical protein